MTLSTSTLQVAADLLELELAGRKDGDDRARTAELAGARLELLLELRQRADAETVVAGAVDRVRTKASGFRTFAATDARRRRVTP